MRGRSDESARVLPLCHLPGLPRVGVPTDQWYSHGFTSLSDDRQLGVEDVEERALATTLHHRSTIRRRHVHCTPGPQAQELLDHLNGVEPSIQFTVETESEGRLPFLDVLLQRDVD